MSGQRCCAHCHAPLAGARRAPGVILCEPCERVWEVQILSLAVPPWMRRRRETEDRALLRVAGCRG